VLDNGRIVAEGDFDTLRKNSLAFQLLWEHQEMKNKHSNSSDDISG
jgi:ABC-type multidrug transport system fused ATPase/permease subunit